MLRSVRERFASDYALDLGTATTQLYVSGIGVVADEPSFVSVRNPGAPGREVKAVGARAKELWGKTSSKVVTASPLRDGIVRDTGGTKDLVSYFVRKIPYSRRMVPSRVVLGVPGGTTEVNRRAFVEAAARGYAGEFYLVDSLVASAVGAGLPVDEARGSMIVDLGAGAARAGILSLGGVVSYGTTRSGGVAMDDKIRDHVRSAKGLSIGERTAERVKIALGAARSSAAHGSVTVDGIDVRSGLPTRAEVTGAEICDLLADTVAEIVRLVRTVLESAPPEVSWDVSEHGIVLVGGGAMLRDLDRVIARDADVPVAIAERPASAVAVGSGAVLEQWDRYQALVVRGHS